MRRLLIATIVLLLSGHCLAQSPARLVVPHIQASLGEEWWHDIEQAMDDNEVLFVPIDKVGWPEEYPYAPQVQFRIAYTDTEILLQYDVVEQGIRATYATDSGARPYTDSCVEFFLSPNADSLYYNLEVTCIGVATFDGGPLGGDRPRAGSEVMRQIRRHSTLGNQPLGETTDTTHWRLTIAMPHALIIPDGEEISGRTMRANFYKCGDAMTKPHYLSWSPINHPRPSFHQPAQFGYLYFE